MKKAKSQGQLPSASSFFENPSKIFLVLFLICLVVFGNSIGNRYSLDDEFVTYNNIQVMKGVEAIPDIFTSRYVMDGEKAKYGYRPVVKLTFALENEFFGQNPHIGHFINIVLYTLCCFVLFLFLRRILREHTAAFSFWIVLIFLLHPFHNEVVVSLKNRDALLSLLFGLMSMNFVIDAVEKNRMLHYVWTVLFLVLALLSKTDVLTFLFLIPFTLYFFKIANLKRTMVIGVLLGLIFFAGKLSVGSLLADIGNKRDFVFVENPLFFIEGIMPRIVAAFSTFGFYVVNMIFPSKLLSYYGYNVVEILEWNFYAFVGLAVSVSLIIYFVVRFRIRDPLYYGLVFFCVSSSMFLNLVKPVVGVVAERFMFTPSIGFCIAAVAIFYKVFHHSSQTEKRLFPKSGYSTMIVIICLVFTIQGMARNVDWKDHLTLYEADSEKAPMSSKLHALSGALLVQEVLKDPKQTTAQKKEIVKRAVDHYKKSIEIYPEYITSLNNLGMIYQSYLGRHEDAKALFLKALELDSVYVEAWSNLGAAQLALKDTTEAIHSYQNAVKLKPDFILAYTHLTGALVKQQRFAEAMQVNLSALKISQDGSLYLNLGKIYVHKGDTLTGVSYLARASDIDPSNRQLSRFLFDHYKRKGDLQSAGFYKQRFEAGNNSR